MFQSVQARTVGEYLKALPRERQEPIRFLHAFIQKAAPTLKPYFATNMLGYGRFKYRNYKKELIDWPVVALASQKNYISLYVCALDRGKYLAEMFEKDLGQVSVGKSCIRFKRIEDLDLKTLRRVLQLAAKKPGLATTGA